MTDRYSDKSLEYTAFADNSAVDSSCLKSFIEKAEKHGYIFKNILVYRNSKQVIRCFRKPFSPDFPHINYAFCTTLVATAIGFAVNEGLIHTDTAVGEFFEDELNAKEMANVGDITVQQLLSMTSGVGSGTVFGRKSDDRFKAFANSKRRDKQFVYNGDNFSVLSRMLTKSTGLTVSEYLTPRLFDPLGIERPVWETDALSFDNGGYGLFLKAEDIAKITQCFLNGGRWGSLQIIPPSWVEDMTSVKVSGVSDGHYDDLCYGYGTFIDRKRKCIYFENLFGQYTVLFPEYDAFLIINSAKIPKNSIMPLIHKYFPKILRVSEKSDGKTQDINEYLNSLSCPLLKSGPRNLASEMGISGNLYKLFRRKYFSVQTLSEIFNLCKKPGYMDEITLDFFESHGEITWNEAVYGKNSLKVSLDNEILYSEIYLSESNIHYIASGKWTADGKLIVQLLSMEFPEIRRFAFSFSKNRIRIKSRSNTKLSVISCCNYQYHPLNKNVLFRLLIKAVSFILSPRYTPSLTFGKCRYENGINKSNI